MRDFQIGDHAGLNIRGIGLRNIDIDPQFMHIGDFEKLGRIGLRSVMHERADIDVARGHHAIEGRDEMFEIFKRGEVADIGLGRGDFGEPRLIVAGLFVGHLLRNRVRLLQRFPPVCGDFGERRIGLGFFEFALGLVELLIEVRRIDIGQHIAGFHFRANVLVPHFDIAADAGMERRRVPGLNVTREHEALIGRAVLWVDDHHRRNGALVRPFLEIGFALARG